MQNTAIIGTQWGDEGKGKITDAISVKFDIICRSTGGSNAGHTIMVDGEKFVFHILPSCLLHPKTIAVIGNGTVVNLPSFVKEIEQLKNSNILVGNRIKLSLQSHLLFDYHQKIDQELERRKSNKIGTTGRGIGPCYFDKISRIGIRCEDLLDTGILKEKLKNNCQLHTEIFGIKCNAEEEFAKIMEVREEIKPFLTDTRKFLHTAMKTGKNILFEGAQAHHLDIDHGTYPFVTSSSVSIGGVCTGLGIPPQKIQNILGIVKSYTTRVGEGPFPTELLEKMGEELREKGNEFGATTGRPRRCGWFDAVMVKNSVETNGIMELNLTKLDVLSGIKEIKIAIKYFLDETEIFAIPTTPKALKKLKIEYETLSGWEEDISKIREFSQLPKNAQKYVLRIEKLCGAKISSIGVGADRNDLIFR